MAPRSTRDYSPSFARLHAETEDEPVPSSGGTMPALRPEPPPPASERRPLRASAGRYAIINGVRRGR